MPNTSDLQGFDIAPQVSSVRWITMAPIGSSAILTGRNNETSESGTAAMIPIKAYRPPSMEIQLLQHLNHTARSRHAHAHATGDCIASPES